MFKILRDSKNVFVHIRGSLKFIFLLIIAAAIIVGLMSLVYRPVYAVTLNGEFIGYTTNKSKIQNQINEYIINGDGENIAFVDIEAVPEYELCLLKRDQITTEDEIFKNVTKLGTTYYEYYAILVDFEIQNYTKTKEEAEEIINKLKEQGSTNVDKLAYAKMHETELQEFSEVDSVVTALYVKPVVVARTSGSGASGPTQIASTTTKIDLGISLSSPASGSISSRFGRRGREMHAGLDIAGSHGSAIRAAASGTVISAGSSGSGYGTIVKISHGNGIETLYAHLSSVDVSVGQYVSQGETIGGMGSTGRSTGTHLHFEVRVNGTAVNPEHYVY